MLLQGNPGFFPLYNHIMSSLFLCRDKQEDWLACEARLAPDRRALEEQLSGLRISTPPVISDIQTIKDEITLSVVTVKCVKNGGVGAIKRLPWKYICRVVSIDLPYERVIAAQYRI
jgi:hypothetical protein